MWGAYLMSDIPSLADQPITLEQLLQVYLELTPSSEEVEDYLNQFSEVSKLTSAEQFERWLETNDDDYDSFMERIRIIISMKKFCSHIDKHKHIKAKFEARKHQFDYFVLSRLIFTDRVEAQLACEQIKDQPRSFQSLFQTYAMSDQVQSKGWKEAFIRADLPNEIQPLLIVQPRSSASYLFNHLIGQPLKVNQGWCLIYIHHFIPAC